MEPIYAHIALSLAMVESFGLAALLLRVRGVPGLRLLVLFLAGVGAWCLCCELPTWFGPGVIPLGLLLSALSPLTSAVFVHFVLVLCGVSQTRRVLGLLYGIAGATAVAGLIVPAGAYMPWRGFEHFFVPTAMGWAVGTVWAALATAGHLVMFWHWVARKGPPRGQLVAMCLASGWGLLCMSGYAFAPLGIDAYPFPLLFLPLYPLILVYGILRYELMIVNAWARRALAWALLVGIGSAILIGLAASPLPLGGPVSGWRLWLTAVITLLLAGLLLDPFRRMATRLVYPGSHVTPEDIEGWRATLAQAESHEALATLAARTISALLRIDIEVGVGRAAAGQRPALACINESGRWNTRMSGWDAAPPGPRYTAQLFGTALAESAQRLEQAMSLALREREQQQQARLAELGALAATVAHDIRNPLNIINMAAAMANAEVRREITAQTTRISQLASDLLDYAKSWQIEKRPLDLADLARTLATGYPNLTLGAGIAPGLTIDGDARRLQQALLNLLDNARAATAHGGRILIDAVRSADGVELLVCDEGAGVPAEIRETLFQPFVSRRPDGTGLGLAIVAKIMLAHGGGARLDEHAGWNTCFILNFPARTAP